jgi:hypothetical protein
MYAVVLACHVGTTLYCLANNKEKKEECSYSAEYPCPYDRQPFWYKFGITVFI